jgi:large subunit ribosomal protein L17
LRHGNSGKKLGRDSAHRAALYSNLTGALIEHGRIRTTVSKAKAVRPLAEQMITLGRRGDLHARRQAVAFLRSKDVVHKLFDEIGPRFKERPGGYSRIVKLGPRPGDAAEMAYLELVDTPLVFKSKLTDVPTEIEAEEGAPAVVAEAAEPEAKAETGIDEDTPEEEAVEGEPDAEAELSADAGAETAVEEPEATAEPASETESPGDGEAEKS